MTHYLKDGSEIEFVKKVDDDRAIVKRIQFVYPYDSEEEEQIVGDEEVVKFSSICKKPPVNKLHTEIKEAKEQLKSLNDAAEKKYLACVELNLEISKLKKTKTDLSQLIINKSEIINAGRIFTVTGYRVNEVSKLEPKKETKLNIEVNMFNGVVRAWSERIEADLGYCGSNYFDKEIGLIIDPKEGEIDEIIKEKVRRNKSKLLEDNYDLVRIEDKYLDPQLLQRKRVLIINGTTKDIKLKQQEIDRLAKDITNLKKRLTEI